MKVRDEHVVTCGQMKILERRADEAGLSYYQMMENAGGRAVEIILDKVGAFESFAAPGSMVGEYTSSLGVKHAAKSDSNADSKCAAKSDSNSPAISALKASLIPEAARGAASEDVLCANRGDVFIFCGKGNNGGDGFVAARLLCEKGYDITVILVDGIPKTADAVTNFDLLRELPIAIKDMTRNSRALMELKKTPDIIIDAIYGTGFRGKLEGCGRKAAMFINSFSDSDRVRSKETTVFAMDVPSGMRGDMVEETEFDSNSVKAHYTITFHAKKPVHMQDFAAKKCGAIIVADIGIDEERLWNVKVK